MGFKRNLLVIVLVIAGFIWFNLTPSQPAVSLEQAPKVEQESPRSSPEGTVLPKTVPLIENRETQTRPVETPQKSNRELTKNEIRQIRPLEWYEKDSPFVVVKAQPTQPQNMNQFRNPTPEEQKMRRRVGDGNPRGWNDELAKETKAKYDKLMEQEKAEQDVRDRRQYEQLMAYANGYGAPRVPGWSEEKKAEFRKMSYSDFLKKKYGKPK